MKNTEIDGAFSCLKNRKKLITAEYLILKKICRLQLITNQTTIFMATTNKLVSNAGKPISLADAEEYVDEYRDLKKVLKDNILVKITEEERLTRALRIAEAEILFSSEANAFIFSKETILRFFEESDSNPNPAEYLMVFFAAKFRNDPEKSRPTIVLAGVNEVSDNSNIFVSLDMEEPATEQPPFKVDFSFPPHNEEKKLIVKINKY